MLATFYDSRCVDQRLKDESGAANELFHVNLSHVAKVLDTDANTITPIVGGRVDRELARHMTGAAFEHEYWHLTWFRAFFSYALGEDWLADFDSMKEVFRACMKEVFGATGYNAETNLWLPKVKESAPKRRL